MKKKVVVFLDFDGVLHHYFPKSENTDLQNSHFYYLKNFEDVINEFKKYLDISIVISSAWRKQRSLEELKSLFSKEIQPYIIDKTPVIDDNNRELETNMWIEINDFNGFWIAIDDTDFLFKTKSNLVHCYDKFERREQELLKIKFVQILS